MRFDLEVERLSDGALMVMIKFYPFYRLPMQPV